MQPETTRWSLVALAGDQGGPQSAAALAELCALWRPAVLAFLRRTSGGGQAEDLTQSFFVHFIENSLTARADRTRGRFRSFVYSGLRRWWIDQERARTSGKRGGGRPAVDIDDIELRDTHAQPEAVFDRDWAICLVREGLRRLRAEADRDGRIALYVAAEPFLIEEPEPGDYARAATALGLSPNTFAVAVGRLRKRLQRTIRALVADTAASGEDAADEMRRLRSALRSA